MTPTCGIRITARLAPAHRLAWLAPSRLPSGRVPSAPAFSPGHLPCPWRHSSCLSLAPAVKGRLGVQGRGTELA